MTLVATSLLLVAAFRAMPLADATAISFAAPSIVTILAIALLGERVTVARVASVVAGFAGVVLIVRPGSDVFRGAALLPLIAAATTAAYQVLTRKLAGDDTRAMLFYSSAVGAVILSLFLPWRGFAHDFSAGDVAAMAALGLLAIAGHFLFIRALQLAPASGLASITYVQLVFATLIGLVVFGDFPDLLTLAGVNDANLVELSRLSGAKVALRGEGAAKTNRLELTQSRFQAQKIATTEQLSSIEDADMAQAITDATMRESVYRSALAVGAKVIQPSLVDFLR